MKKVLYVLVVLLVLFIVACQKDPVPTVDNENPLESLSIVEENQSITISGTVQLTVHKNPSNNNDTVIWESLNQAVATVSQTGLVTGVAAGGTIIKVKNSTGTIFDTIIITVTEQETEVGIITWSGLEPTTAIAGNEYDLKYGLTVIDSIDGDITDQVIILNDIDHETELKANGWYNDYLDFEANLTGTYYIHFKVENSTGVVEYRRKQVVVEQGYNVVNGSFTLKKSFWTLDAPGGTATWSVQADGYAHVSISNSGTEWWAVQLIQSVMLKSGKTYKMSVTAKSPQQKTISFMFEDPTDGYRMLSGGIVVQRLTSEFKTYDTFFTADKNYSSAKAVIYMGHMSDSDSMPSTTPDEVIIQQIRIEEVTVDQSVVINVPANVTYPLDGFTLNANDQSDKPLYDPMASVTATKSNQDITNQVKVIGLVTPNVLAQTNYLIQYLVEGEGVITYVTRKVTVTMEKEYYWQIINDHFTNWLAGWTVDMNQTNAPGSSANFLQDADGLLIEMVKKGSANWHMQILQSGLRFEKDVSYTVQIRLKGSNLGANSTVAFEVAANTGSGFNPVEGASMSVILTEDFETYEFTFTPTANLNNARIGFQFGNVNVGTVIIVNYFTINLVS